MSQRQESSGCCGGCLLEFLLVLITTLLAMLVCKEAVWF